MEQLVGRLLDTCLLEVLLLCKSKPLMLVQSTSTKVKGTGEMRILRIIENENAFECLVGLF